MLTLKVHVINGQSTVPSLCFSLHGGDLDGPNGERLLNSLDCPKDPLFASVPAKFQNFVECLRMFKLVKESCFGVVLYDGWNAHINNFETSYRALKISVTPKVHNVFYEVPIYIKKTGLPLGVRCEQKFESVHSDMKPTWSWYKRSENHSEYDSQLKRAMIDYNSFHLTLLFGKENEKI